jgi:pilus assembly protein Flp/PilA
MRTSFQYFAIWFRAHASDRGASLVEYALLIALIAIVCLAALVMLGNNASGSFDSTAQSLQ